MDNEESLPAMDDVQVDGQSEQQLLDAVMQGSELAQAAGLVPLPNEEIVEDGPVESDEQEDQDTEEAVSEDEGEEVEIVEEEDIIEDAAQAATQDIDVYTADDLDLDAQVSVKIDGEETAVSFGDLLKGYTTEQSLSKKGRELGEARAALDKERTEKLEELDKVVLASAGVIGQTEQAFAKQYHDFEASIKKARDDGDTFEVNELKDKREQTQESYWKARNQREGMMKAAEEHKNKALQENYEKEIQYFQQTIPTLIPDFNESVATKIREFAIAEGINAESLDRITDPAIVKFVDDFRRLKQGVTKGTAKRKAVASKKALPTKKPTSAKRKTADKESMIKARAFKQGSSKADQDAFLRQFASKSLNL